MLQKVPKATRPLNVSIDSNLIEDARHYDINISALLNQALRQEIAKRWQEENKEAFEHARKRIEEHGLWNDGLRSWE